MVSTTYKWKIWSAQPHETMYLAKNISWVAKNTILKCYRSALLLYPFSFLAFLVLWPGWGYGDSPGLDVHAQSLIVEVEESLIWHQLDLK